MRGKKDVGGGSCFRRRWSAGWWARWRFWGQISDHLNWSEFDETLKETTARTGAALQQDEKQPLASVNLDRLPLPSVFRREKVLQY